MLNIVSRISLSKASKKFIKTYSRSVPWPYLVNSWSSVNKFVKNELSKKLLFNQNMKCIYCERYLPGLEPEIDHFVAKNHFPEFSFVPTNLFYACGMCNSTGRKGRKNVMDVYNVNFGMCTFNIIHPYFEIPDDHIKFSDSDRIYLDYDACSEKGKVTVDFFNFTDVVMTNIRARQLSFERLNPLTSQEQKELINAIVTYKASK